MKRLVFYFAFLTISFALTSCDMFRSLAGRPTSEEIEAKREIIRAEQAARAEAVEDSLAKVRQAINDAQADSAATEAFAEMALVFRPAKQYKIEIEQLLADTEYYAVMGSFKDAGNAARKAESITEAGFGCVVVNLYNGLKIVLVPAGNAPRELLDRVNSIKKMDFCPSDLWILQKSEL